MSHSRFGGDRGAIFPPNTYSSIHGKLTRCDDARPLIARPACSGRLVLAPRKAYVALPLSSASYIQGILLHATGLGRSSGRPLSQGPTQLLRRGWRPLSIAPQSLSLFSSASRRRHLHPAILTAEVGKHHRQAGGTRTADCGGSIRIAAILSVPSVHHARSPMPGFAIVSMNPVITSMATILRQSVSYAHWSLIILAIHTMPPGRFRRGTLQAN
jgi:hypothetical protein